MTEQSAQPGINEILQTVLDDDISVDLRPRDVALLVLIRHRTDSRMDLSFAIEQGELRALAARVDSLDVKDPAGSEKRLTESLNRLIRANCLARADLTRLRSTEDTEYQLTSLGENIASWHIEHTRFTGEPLAAILQAFNSQLLDLRDKAIELDSEAEWRKDKSTLVMCLDYALLPDRKVLDIRPISDVQDPHQAGMDTLLARINPAYGYAYVVLDVQTRHGKRLLAGIHARGENGRGELTRFYIDNYPIDAPLQEASGCDVGTFRRH